MISEDKNKDTTADNKIFSKLDSTEAIDNKKVLNSNINDLKMNNNNSQLESASRNSIISSQSSNSSKPVIVQKQLTPIRIDDHPLKIDPNNLDTDNDNTANKDTENIDIVYPSNQSQFIDNQNKSAVSPSNESKSQPRSRAASTSRSIVNKRRSLIQPLIAYSNGTNNNNITNNANNNNPHNNLNLNNNQTSNSYNESNNIFFNKRNSSQLSVGNSSTYIEKTRFHSRENSDSIIFDYSNLTNLDTTTDPLIHTNVSPISKMDDILIASNSSSDINELLKNLALMESNLFEKKQEIEELKKQLQYQEKLYDEQANDLRILKERVSKHLNEKSNIIINQSPQMITTSSTPSKKTFKNKSRTISMKKLTENANVNDDNTLQDEKLKIRQPNSDHLDKKCEIEKDEGDTNKDSSINDSFDVSFNENNNDSIYDYGSPIKLRQRNKSQSNKENTKNQNKNKINSDPKEQKRIGSTNSIYEDNTSLPLISPQLPPPKDRDSMWTKSISMLNQFDQIMQNELERSLNWEDDDTNNKDNDSSNNNIDNENRSITESFLPETSVTTSIWNFVNDVKTNILSVVQEEESNVNLDNDTMKEFKTIKKNKDDKELEMSQFV